MIIMNGIMMIAWNDDIDDDDHDNDCIKDRYDDDDDDDNDYIIDRYDDDHEKWLCHR